MFGSLCEQWRGSVAEACEGPPGSWERFSGRPRALAQKGECGRISRGEFGFEGQGVADAADGTDTLALRPQ